MIALSGAFTFFFPFRFQVAGIALKIMKIIWNWIQMKSSRNLIFWVMELLMKLLLKTLLPHRNDRCCFWLLLLIFLLFLFLLFFLPNFIIFYCLYHFVCSNSNIQINLNWSFLTIIQRMESSDIFCAHFCCFPEFVFFYHRIVKIVVYNDF